MYACMHEYMYISVYVCTNACMYQNQKNQIKNILFLQDCDINGHEQY